MKWLSVFLIFFLPPDGNSFKIIYQVEASSKLFLNGSTSINTFQCYCTDQFPVSTLSGELNESTHTITFSNAQLLIETKLLNCKNKLMNRDMHKALKAQQFPHISVTLLNIAAGQTPVKHALNTWYEYKANTILTIAGVSKPLTITVQLKKTSPHLYKLVAASNVLMSDFNVKPRTPFNMIKIDDLVTINFIMNVIVKEE